MRPGARSGGRAEVQVLRIYGDVDASTNETQPVRGLLLARPLTARPYSPYVSARGDGREARGGAGAAPDGEAGRGLRAPHAAEAPPPAQRGVEYSITFATHVGDQPTLFKDAQYLYHPALGGAADSSITGAENAADDVTGSRRRRLGRRRGARALRLRPRRRRRRRTRSRTSSRASRTRCASRPSPAWRGPCADRRVAEVPQQIADPPTDVSVGVNPGDADSLTISFGEPESDGGATVTHYRAELDPTHVFDDPIRRTSTTRRPTSRRCGRPGRRPLAPSAAHRRRARSSSRCSRAPWPTRRTRSSTTPSRCRATRSTSERLCTAGR